MKTNLNIINRSLFYLYSENFQNILAPTINLVLECKKRRYDCFDSDPVKGYSYKLLTQRYVSPICYFNDANVEIKMIFKYIKSTNHDWRYMAQQSP